MKFISLKKEYPGKFLSYYVATFENSEKKLKHYEFISRNKNLNGDNFGCTTPAGVGIIPLSVDGKKILLQQEFRLSCNNWVLCFPTGLIDEGETPVQSAVRELWEETGVTLNEVIEVLPPSYASAPTSDEVMVMVICKASGDIKKSTSADEEIKAKWYTKEEVRKLFTSNILMSVRSQIYLYNWMNEVE